MLDVVRQIESGRLVCPVTKQRLLLDGDRLRTEDGRRSYSFEGGVPVLVADAAAHARYSRDSDGSMAAEYEGRPRASTASRLFQRLRRTGGDHRSPASRAAFDAVIGGRSADDLCVSVGGGPERAHPNLVNLNLGPFDNVDVVGDAYALPWADGSVDALHCEAVLEHLEHPRRAAAEMHRVLRPGGELFAATPFLQGYHAYPGHFQNFTVEGHDALLRRAGFEIVDSGACVGPTFALTDLGSLYLRTFVPGRLLSRLLLDGDRLRTEDGRRSYSFEGGVPVLVPDAAAHARYSRDSDGSMAAEYGGRPRASTASRLFQRLRRTGGDHRSPASRAAFEAVVGNRSSDDLCVSVGGGPERAHPDLVNLNIGRFDNVDVVGDAYALPWADGSVDAIHCEAVLEHLEHPRRAAAEMHRVLRPGGELFAATPFLQGYHAYPGHFQNFTLEGHDALLRRAGFEIVDSGACVGPTFALTDLGSLYLRTFVPGRLPARLLQAAALLVSVPLRFLDRRLHRSGRAHVLASTVFARARKP